MEAPPVPVPQPNEKEFDAKKAAHDADVCHPNMPLLTRRALIFLLHLLTYRTSTAT